MSIATGLGDAGQTSLVGGLRVSKAELRVESYGTVDELNSFLGFARSLCSDAEIAGWTETIQRTLFRVGGELSALATAPQVLADDVAWVTELVHRIETTEGVLADWSLPGAHRESAAYEMCRTVCRRAERATVRLHEAGEAVRAELLAYLNRLSDLLWLFGRLIEYRAGVDARLRTENGGGKWTRAW